jgi:Trypsin-co-occurring domain 1
MSELLKFNSEEGATVLVEVADDPRESVTRGGRTQTAVVEARESLERVLGQLGPMVKGIVSELRSTADWPDEVEIEFAVKVSADSNVIIARVGGEANFRIALRWSGAQKGR